MTSFDSVLARLEPRDQGYESACGVWTGAIGQRTGYGNVKFNGRVWLVHRLVFETIGGPLPAGYVPDHLCHSFADYPCAGGPTCPHRACARFDHLEAVTQRVNINRGARRPRPGCPWGHLLVEPNLMPARLPYRACLSCHRAHARGVTARSSGRSFDFQAVADEIYVSLGFSLAPA